MGKMFLTTVDGEFIYGCIQCNTHITNYQNLISKAFTGTTGQAYLFNKVININKGLPFNKILRTGPHTISSIFCSNCMFEIGWKYDHAFLEREKYKEGRTILEKAKLVKLNWPEERLDQYNSLIYDNLDEFVMGYNV